MWLSNMFYKRYFYKQGFSAIWKPSTWLYTGFAHDVALTNIAKLCKACTVVLFLGSLSHRQRSWKHFLKWTVTCAVLCPAKPSQAELCQGGSLASVQALLWKPNQNGTTVVCTLHPFPGCDTFQWGTVRFCVWAIIVAWYSTFWYALDHCGKWSIVAYFQTGSAWVWCALVQT